MTIAEAMRAFSAHDAQRRSGAATGPGAAIDDRRNEGALISAILGPAAPLAAVPATAAAAGYEGVKALGQRTGLGRACMEAAREAAVRWPADAIRLDAYDAEAGAGGFYAKCGYREVGRVVYRNTPLVYYELRL